MEAPIYNKEGKNAGTVTLPAQIFGLPWNADLVHQVVTAMESSARKPIAHAKDRSEVSGGGKKPWKQKGTGRARHGSTRSPIWRHGGVTHGPKKDANFERKINRAAKVKALYTILSRKVKSNELVPIDSLALSQPKTKEASGVLKNLSNAAKAPSLAWTSGKRALVLVAEGDVMTKRSFRNIPSVLVEEVRNVNPVDAARYKYIVLANPAESIKLLENRAR